MGWNMDARLNRRQAATFLNISPNLVSVWKAAGLINPVETTPQGHTLYRLGDLLEVERATRRSPKSSRNPERRPASGPGSWADISRKPTALSRTS